MRTMAEWPAGARGWVVLAVLAAALAGALVDGTLIPGSLGGTPDRIGELAAQPNSLPNSRQTR